MFKAVRYFSVSSLFALIAGCGSQYTTVSLVQKAPESISPASPIPDSKSIFIEKFSDVRSVAKFNVIGEAKTGMFNKQTPILIEDSLGTYLSSILKAALRQERISVEENTDFADIIMKGRVNEFWLQEFASGYASEYCEAKIELDLALFNKLSDSPIWYDIKRSRVKSKSTIIDISSQNEKIMNQAINEIIVSLLADSTFRSALTAKNEDVPFTPHENKLKE